MAKRFSDHFGLNKSQAELDFVDIPLNTDLPLFVDPYAVSVEEDPWFRECNDLIVGYFQLVVDSIRNNDIEDAKRLLSNLHEPNDTHLGYSRGKPDGRGIGNRQADALFQRLRTSEAVRTGRLQDLADCELIIPGVGTDKISDITINVIRGKLVEYTESQCRLLDITTQRVPSGIFWDGNRKSWINRYANLPVYKNQRLMLVPKVAVRFRLTADHQQYYRHFVLNYLQAEHLEANSSLVTVLKNGRRRVTKKDLEKEYPLSKEFLFSFSENHPEILEKYKESLVGKAVPLRDEQIEETQSDTRGINSANLAKKLASIPSGHATADKYHEFIMGALECLFYPGLRKPVKEQELHGGRKRVDITFNNGADNGFFFDLTVRHGIQCPYIFFECKNYSSDPKNPEFDQLTGRFSNKRGMFGVLVCRTIDDKESIRQRCRDIAKDNRGYVLVFDDSDIETFLQLRSNSDYEQINDYLDDKFRNLIM